MIQARANPSAKGSFNGIANAAVYSRALKNVDRIFTGVGCKKAVY